HCFYILCSRHSFLHLSPRSCPSADLPSFPTRRSSDLREDLQKEDLGALAKGIENLERHVENIRKFGIRPVVALNLFHSDTEAERDFMRQWAKDFDVAYAEADVFTQGGAGAEKLGQTLLNNLEGTSTPL